MATCPEHEVQHGQRRFDSDGRQQPGLREPTKNFRAAENGQRSKHGAEPYNHCLTGLAVRRLRERTGGLVAPAVAHLLVWVVIGMR